jgi:hypothetical protein
MGTCNRSPAQSSLANEPVPRTRPLDSQPVTWRSLLARVQARVARPQSRIVPGRELGDVVEIARLACPLRYDLRIRIDFVRLLSRQWDTYQNDLPGFLRQPESLAYRVWFRDVACARFQPQLVHDESRLATAFVDRVHETARLWRSIESNGYNPATPIQLRAGDKVKPVNGKLLQAAYFAGDGCHRMACLSVLGQTSLQPEQYEVKILQSFEPLDNTSVLIRQLPLAPQRYLHFLSSFYCDGRELDTPEAILAQVASVKPDLLGELQSVLAFDLPSLRNQ